MANNSPDKIDLSNVVNDPDDHDDIDCTGTESGEYYDHQNEQQDNGKALEKTLAKEETTAVHVLRIFIMLVLLVAAVMVSAAVFLYMKRDEENTFDQHYHDLATRLVEGFQANTKLRLQVMDMLCLSITSSALATQQPWPFVTISDFDARVTAARSILGSEAVSVYPMVTKEQRRQWEAYTQDPDNISWTNESFAYQEDFLETHGYSSSVTRQSRMLVSDYQNFDFSREDSHPDDPSPQASNNVTYDGTYGSNPQLFRAGDPNSSRDDGDWVNEDEDAPGPFLPMWQVSPTREDIIYQNINVNLLDPYYPESYTKSFLNVHSKGEAVIGGVWNVDDAGYIDEDDDFDDRVVPAAALMYPIFDEIVGEKRVVAVTELDFEFGPFFSSVLPPNSHAITCVVSNCDQTFTFEVTGEIATYMGYEDLHDKKYDDWMISAKMTDFDKASGGTVYSGAPVSKDYCPWTLKVYATEDLEDAYVTDKPFYYTAAVLGMFIFTCSVFILYDFLNERRQKKVMTKAVKSDKIVASLFPGTFRDAVYDQQAQDEEEEKNKHTGAFQPNAMGIGSLTRQGQRGSIGSNSESSRKRNNGDPMAQLYPHCTVFFADLAGFTQWSSNRTPTEVFFLLESLYGAFDKIARRLGVFKIETIGDCYVAVTGLPTPQSKHALIMARFSQSCISKMNEIINSTEILSKLGDETADLSLRVGMHSGPVTAGVLRGEKARFQLFGDTVNTAARMESNGQKGRIQVSSTTASLLSTVGKSHWLTAREDLVDAKGKGKMQCYWVSTVVPEKSYATSVMSSSFMSSESGTSADSEINHQRRPLAAGVSVVLTASQNSEYEQEVEI